MSDVVEIGRAEKVEAGDVYNIHVTGSPLSIARAIRDVKETHGYNFAQLVEVIPFSMGQISKYLSLLRLEPEIQQLLEDGRLAWSTGYALIGLPPEERLRIIKEKGDDRLTLKEAEEARKLWNMRTMSGIFEDIATISAAFAPVEMIDPRQFDVKTFEIMSSLINRVKETRRPHFYLINGVKLTGEVIR